MICKFILVCLLATHSFGDDCSKPHDDTLGISLSCCVDNCRLRFSKLSEEHPKYSTGDAFLFYKVSSITLDSHEVETLPVSIVTSPEYSLAAYKSTRGSFKSIGKRHFANMVKLKSLLLVAGELTIICGDTFGDLVSLVELSLRGNEIKFLHPDLLKNLRSLRKLDVAENSIEILHPRAFESLASLEEVYLSENGLIYLDQRQFAHNQMISVLHLSKNSFEYINGDAFDGLTSLTDFSIDENACVVEGAASYENRGNRSVLIIPEFKKSLMASNCSSKTSAKIKRINEQISQFTESFKSKSFSDKCDTSQSFQFNLIELNSSSALFANALMLILISLLAINLM